MPSKGYTTGPGKTFWHSTLRDFNKDQIWDLAICEIPAGGYPNIKKAINATKKHGFFADVDGKKKGISHLSLIDWAFDALDEKLGKLMN